MYNVSTMTTPTVLYWADHDWLADPKVKMHAITVYCLNKLLTKNRTMYLKFLIHTVQKFSASLVNSLNNFKILLKRCIYIRTVTFKVF